MDYIINTEQYESEIKHFCWLGRPYKKSEKNEWNWNVMKIMDDDDFLAVMKYHYPHAHAAEMQYRQQAG